MSLFSAFFLYAIVFRLAVIAAGTVSIVLGYRLFTRGIQTGPANSADATFNAKVAGQEFALKNAAPGTFFALFGVIIISIMVIQGLPRLTLKPLTDAQRAGNSAQPGELTLRSGAPPASNKFDNAVQKGLEYDRQNDTANAVTSYEEAMTEAAAPMNQLAWDYLQQGKVEDALPPRAPRRPVAPRPGGISRHLGRSPLQKR